MTKKLKFIVFLVGFCLISSGTHAARVYMWTDQSGRMHITDEKPPADENARLQDIIEYEPRPAIPSGSQAQKGQAESGSETGDEGRKDCDAVLEARRLLRQAQEVAVAVRERAEEARQKARDLRERIGFDDEEMEDRKYDLIELEKKARRAELFAEQAELDVRLAELQVTMAELETEGRCEDERDF